MTRSRRLPAGRNTVRKSATQTSDSYRRIWQSRAFVVMLIVVVFVIGVSVVKEITRRLETLYEIEQLQSEVDRLEQRNIQAQDLIALLNTSTLQEQTARVKLNVQRDGEAVVMLPERRLNNQVVLPDSDRIEYIQIDAYQPNPQKWFTYFWNQRPT